MRKNRFTHKTPQVDDACNALVRPVPSVVKILKQPGLGDVGLRVKYDKDTGKPVLYLWQTFTYVRLDFDQMQAVRSKIKRLVRAHRKSPRPKK